MLLQRAGDSLRGAHFTPTERIGFQSLPHRVINHATCTCRLAALWRPTTRAHCPISGDSWPTNTTTRLISLWETLQVHWEILNCFCCWQVSHLVTKDWLNNQPRLDFWQGQGFFPFLSRQDLLRSPPNSISIGTRVLSSTIKRPGCETILTRLRLVPKVMREAKPPLSHKSAWRVA